MTTPMPDFPPDQIQPLIDGPVQQFNVVDHMRVDGDLIRGVVLHAGVEECLVGFVGGAQRVPTDSLTYVGQSELGLKTLAKAKGLS